MTMEIPSALAALVAGRDLSRQEIESLFGRLMDGELSDAVKAALLVGLAAKGESAQEIAGAAAAMRRRAVVIPHDAERVVDTCGTGGDGQGTFNISTAAALVAAAGGAVVAKHGNRSVSSRSGSADVLGELGVELELDAAAMGRCLEEVGVAFLFAPLLHPAMREVMPVRRELGVRTIFNLLGPLTNPAGARRQLLGVYHRGLVEPVAEVLRELGSEHALVVHGDGLDEITTSGATLVGEVRDGTVRLFEVEPESFGLERRDRDELRGGEPAENAAAMRRILDGEEGALADVVAFNAAAALYVAGLAEELRDGLERAREALRRGDAAATLERLRSFAREARGG
jgi:anthranilate phosphoribosyltransferase